jgi:hypothetical protein
VRDEKGSCLARVHIAFTTHEKRTRAWVDMELVLTCLDDYATGAAQLLANNLCSLTRPKKYDAWFHYPLVRKWILCF